MNTVSRPVAIVTGASSGIGRELALQCAEHGFDLILAADRPLASTVAEAQARGASVVAAIETDLATQAGVDRLYEASRSRPVEALLANAGHGEGGAFLGQDFRIIQHIVNTNILGTLDILHRVGRDMAARETGRILITGSIAGFMPGAFQAVYNGTEAFIKSFSWALRNELKDTGVSVTCLMPGATETEFFARANMLDTKVGSGPKDSAAEVARMGFVAMMNGEGNVVAGLKNKIQAAMAHMTPASVLAKQHRKMAQPDTRERH